jgi:hypothetical protein
MSFTTQVRLPNLFLEPPYLYSVEGCTWFCLLSVHYLGKTQQLSIENAFISPLKFPSVA